MIWYTADLHLGHARICELAGRPFDSVDEMNRSIIDTINWYVKPGDMLICLGDAAMGRMVDSIELMRQIEAFVILVPGNHDRTWPGYPQKPERLEQWRRDYAEAGWQTALPPFGRVLDGRIVNCSHFPYRGQGDHTDEDRYDEWRLEDDGRWLLHGHVHELWQQNGRMINVGIDAWGGIPVPESMLIDMIQAGPSDGVVPENGRRFAPGWQPLHLSDRWSKMEGMEDSYYTSLDADVQRLAEHLNDDELAVLVPAVAAVDNSPAGRALLAALLHEASLRQAIERRRKAFVR